MNWHVGANSSCSAVVSLHVYTATVIVVASTMYVCVHMYIRLNLAVTAAMVKNARHSRHKHGRGTTAHFVFRAQRLVFASACINVCMYVQSAARLQRAAAAAVAVAHSSSR